MSDTRTGDEQLLDRLAELEGIISDLADTRDRFPPSKSKSREIERLGDEAIQYLKKYYGERR